MTDEHQRELSIYDWLSLAVPFAISFMLAGSHANRGLADRVAPNQWFFGCVWSRHRWGWPFGRNTQFSDAQLFEAWKGGDAALRRLLKPGFRATDPAVREFVAKLNLGATGQIGGWLAMADTTDDLSRCD
jgi:hypothetical protein